MKSWLKGGLIGIGVGFLCLIISFVFLRYLLIHFLLTMSFPLILLRLFIEPCVGESCVGMVLLSLFMGFVVYIIISFIIGALMGFIIIKKLNNSG